MTRWTPEQYDEFMRRRGEPAPFQPPANEAAAFGLGRLPTTGMNKTEAAYAAELDHRLRTGELLWWRFEPAKLRLADNTFYTPDFWLMRRDRELEFHETKGFWRDDARVKIKVAASLYPIRFIGITRQGGAWLREEF